MGRKEIPIDIKQVKTLASRGLTHEQIAAALGISHDTLYKRKAKYTEFSDAIKEGQGKGLAQVSNALFEQALGGNTSAAIFYMKNRAGWKDKQEFSGDKENPLNIMFKVQGE